MVLFYLRLESVARAKRKTEEKKKVDLHLATQQQQQWQPPEQLMKLTGRPWANSRSGTFQLTLV